MVGDGEGEGMVAIVQGLQDSRLAVTVLDTRLQGKQTGRLEAIKSSNQVPQKISSVETNTDCLKKSHTSSHICDGQYASSYQLAHCYLQPTSPPVHLPEFPPQRAAPNSTQGNFQVGGSGSREIGFTPVRSSISYRGSLTWHSNRGGSLSPCRASAAFVHSLRRYPSASPTTTLSTELVQRLLTYSQAKHFAKISNHSKSMRSLNHKSPLFTDKQTNTKSTKNIQTYTRTRQESTEKSANTNNEIKFIGGKSRSFKFNWPSSEKRNIKYKDNQLNATYDYLKSTNLNKRLSNRGAEVRYLSDVTKCIKDTIRQIYEDKPVACFQVCPNIRSRYSQHQRQCHRQSQGQQSSSESNNTEVQASLPTMFREASVMTRCEAAIGSLHVNPSTVNICCFCKKPVPCACDPGAFKTVPELPKTLIKCVCKKDNDLLIKIHEHVTNWLKVVPVYASETAEDKVLRGKNIQVLKENLKCLVRDGNIAGIKDAIQKCLKRLPMWCPDSEHDKEVFKNQIADNLFNKLQGLAGNNRFNDYISNWVNEIPLIDSQIVDKGRILDCFILRLKSIESSLPDYKEKLKSEIIDMLEELPIKIDGSRTKFINQMAEKLASKLTESPSNKNEGRKASMDHETAIQSAINNWLQDIPGFRTGSEFDVKEIKKQIEALTKKLLEFQSNGIEDEDVQAQMAEEIEKWLEFTMTSGGVHLDSKIKYKLSQKLIDKLINSEKCKVKKKTRQSSLDESSLNDRSYVQKIYDWLENIPELSDNTIDKKIVENLALKIQEMHAEDTDDEIIQEEIEDWLDNIAKKTGVDFDRRSKGIFAEELLKMLRPSKRADENFKQSILNKIADLIDNETTKLSKSKIKVAKEKISNILAKIFDNISSYKNDRTQMEIVQFLEQEANMNEADAEKLACSLINRVKGMSLSSQPKKTIQSSIKEEISDVLDNFKIHIDDRENLENTLGNILTDEIMRGEDLDRIRDNIYSILYDAHIPEEQAENISLRLVGRAQEISLMYNSRDSKTGSNTKLRYRKRTSSDQMQKEYFKNNAEKVILEFIGEITVKNSLNSKQTITVAASDLVEKLNEIMTNPDFSTADVRNEISQFIRKLSIQSDTPRKELVTDLAERIQKIGFQASTPRKDRKYFRPRRDVSGFDMSSIPLYMDNVSGQAKQLQSEELKYSNELTDIIKIWVNELPIDLNKTEDKGFKETMIKDLVGDIIDRQKYLQLNSDAKTTEFEELEHLKYQVFRWLNKLPDLNDLTNLIPKTEILMDSIKNITIPQLIKPAGKRRNVKQCEGVIPNYFDALQDEISIWMNEIPNLNVSQDSSFNKQNIAEFAGKIQQLQNNGQDIEEEIKKWLRRLAKNKDPSNLNKLAKALKDRLISRGFTDEGSWIQTQDSSIFIQENLFGSILDWLKKMPLYQQGTPQEKLIQEQVVSDLASELKKVLETAIAMPPEVDTDLLFSAEIIKHLKRFPMQMQQKTDEVFISKTSQQLLHFLKGLQMFQNISDRRSRPLDEYLDANIEDWLSTLPTMARRNTAEKRQFDNLKIELKSKIKQLKQDNANNQELIEEIIKYLKMLPIPLVKKNDVQFLKEKAEQLIQSLLALPISARERTPLGDGMDHMLSVESLFGPKKGFKKAADILYENIESWCEALPIHGGDTAQEQERIKTVKQNIATKLINKIGEMNLNPEVFNDDTLYEDLLHDEIDNLLNALPANTELDQTYDEIKSTLINKIKEVKEKTKNELAGHIFKQQLREAIPRALPTQGTLSVEEQASFDVLKDNVADAFLNLHFFGAKEELRNKFRNKINKEILKFSNDYLKRYPASPVDSKKLNQALFNALKSILVPTEESLRNEVEETITKDEIVDWVKDLPMKEQTGTEQLHTNKVISILAKRIHDLEKDKELYSDFDEKLKTEVIKWTKKLPIKPEATNRIDDFVKNLVEILKNTMQSRRFSISAIYSIDDLAEESSVCSYHQSMLEKQQETPSPPTCSNSRMPQIFSPFPPCSLNSEDKAHLQRIRERTSIPTSFKICSPIRKDASVSPAPIDTGSQTEIRPWETCRPCSGMQQAPSTQMSPQRVEMRPEVTPCLRTPTSPCQTGRVSQTSSRPAHDQPLPGQIQASTPCNQKGRYEVSPQVNINEYGWESTDQSSGYKLSPHPCHQPEHSQYQRAPCSQSFTRKPSPCTNISSRHCAPQPCVTPQGSIPHEFLPSQVNIDEDPYVTPKRPRTRFEEHPAQPCFGQEDEVGTSRSFRRPRVTRLGSLDDVQDLRSRKPRRPDRPDDFEWSSAQFQEESDFWGIPSSRRRVIPSDEEMPEPYTRERERKEEKVRCRCRERILTKCADRRRCPSCQTNEESLKRCSKCCGAPCPYPSNLYFR